MKRGALVGSVLALLTTTAAAQSRRYPPEPTDRDAEAEATSRLWESAVDPQRSPYESILALAQLHLDARTTDGLTEAVRLLDGAVALVPADPRAHRLRGEAHMALRAWGSCADDLGAAWFYQHDDAAAGSDDGSTIELRRKLGLCQARAGRLPQAERTLADAAASGTSNGELWMRLGEVRIAMGKLDEAIAALDAARELMDSTAAQALVRWLLAGAYDRARRPADALEQARLAFQGDRALSTLRNPSLPFLGEGEAVYLLGLAASATEPSRPEHALVYFRRFVAIAPQSPWRKRADEHLRDLKRVTYPESVERLSGTATLDLGVAEAAVRKSMPAMRTCLAKLPYTVVGARTTKLGPRSPAVTRVEPRRPANDLFDTPYRTRPSRSPNSVATPSSQGIYVQLEAVELDASAQADVDAGIKCIEALVTTLALPTPKEKDSFYTLYFRVVAP